MSEIDTLNMMRRAVAPTDVGGGPTIEDVHGCCEEIDRLRAKVARLTDERDAALVEVGRLAEINQHLCDDSNR